MATLVGVFLGIDALASRSKRGKTGVAFRRSRVRVMMLSTRDLA